MQLARDRTRDLISRCFVDVLGHRVSAIYAPNVVNTMRGKWEKNNQPTVTTETARLWGEYMSGAAMLSSFFKGEERVAMRVLTNEYSGYVESMCVGEIRGFMHRSVDSSVSSVFEVNKILYGAATPYKTVLTASGNATTDWQAFYDQSEQTPTLVKLETKALDNNDVVCCGLTIQEMPEAKVSLMERRDLFDNSVMMEMVQTEGILAYLNTLFPETKLTKEHIKRVPVDYYCRCNKERFVQKLYTVPTDELASLAKEGVVVLSCSYCNENYFIAGPELDSIVTDKK
ncbi:hypothetical protein Ae201684P_006303 [Aphanomyces euteiches]|uniref:Molecular chaperone Hsp33 n=1 Tax=Aphanomyces euteiches TaxID=100861 RepID=A0A6G0XBJ1_9STRA|nr:hypothetical protein Ae201684_006641 [Aphanomyces euteiches]KAH9090899.1 hypothetical protein Ae201684P_006303 [Aphanomyces euteiches]KAH9132148.1 hypothetical protein AeRB84_021351 [Aphanomyces euteiches]